MRAFIKIFVLFLLTSSPAFAYYHKFIAENSGTRKVRGVLNTIFNQNYSGGSGWYDTFNRTNYHNERKFSHALLVGTPKSVHERTLESNQKAIEAKKKMIAKKKKQKKIDKELRKQPFAYSTVEIPEWDNKENVSMFLVALSRGGMFKGKKASSKIPVDFNIVDFENKVNCKSSEPIQKIKLSENEMKYVQKVYKLDRLLGDDTIYIKYYDPKCLVGSEAQNIAIEYKTKKGKAINSTLDMNFFKSAIRKDFGF